MDLNSRVDRLDEEMKLLKNEIKQVLLEVQEHILNAQNPFNLGSVGFSPAPVPARGSSAGAAGATGIVGGGFVGGGGGYSGGVGVMESVGAGVESHVPSITASQDPIPNAADPAPDQPSPPEENKPVALSSTFDLDSEGPSLGPGGPGLGDDDFDDFDNFENSGDDDFREPLRGSSTRPPARGSIRQGDLERNGSSGSGRRKKPSSKDGKKVTAKTYRSTELRGRREIDNEAEDMDAIEELASAGGKSIDLMTIAGLAQWCDRALKKIGRENLEALVQVSELTGRVNKETKDVLMTILPLFDGKKDDIVSAKEIVSLLAQLDGLLESGPSRDNRLLPFILQDDMDFLPFILQSA